MSSSDSDRPKKPNSKSSTKSSSMVVRQPGQQPVGLVGGPLFMPVPQLIPGVPRGLEYLASVSSIAVQQFYIAYEQSSLEESMCCGNKRSFTMNITDNFMNPVMIIRRPFSCCAGPCLCGYMCSADECLLECPPGNLIGHVKQQGALCNLEYMVKDTYGNNQLYIRAPTCHGCGDTDYEVLLATNMAPIGAIRKKRMFVDDSSIVTFPVNLDVHLKASVLAANYVINFDAYQTTPQKTF